MSIVSELNRITNEVSIQYDLITQIKAVLELKFGGGSGGSSGYTGDLYSFGIATATPASGVTQISFNNILKEPDYFILYLDSADINQYHRAGIVVYDGETIYGQEYYSGTNECNYFENDKNPTGNSYHWRYTYSDNTLTISSYSNSQGGYFHNPGTYTLRYAYKDNENGTIAIEKRIFDAKTFANQQRISDLPGEPVWFSFVLRDNKDAQRYAADEMDIIVFANESGSAGMTYTTNSTYGYTSGTSYYYDENDNYMFIRAVRYPAGFDAGEYSLIYAYVPF